MYSTPRSRTDGSGEAKSYSGLRPMQQLMVSPRPSATALSSRFLVAGRPWNSEREISIRSKPSPLMRRATAGKSTSHSVDQ